MSAFWPRLSRRKYTARTAAKKTKNCTELNVIYRSLLRRIASAGPPFGPEPLDRQPDAVGESVRRLAQHLERLVDRYGIVRGHEPQPAGVDREPQSGAAEHVAHPGAGAGEAE